MQGLVTQIRPLMFTSELSLLQFRWDGQVRFDMYRGAAPIFTAQYIPDSSGLVSVYDLDRLLEMYIDAVAAEFTFRVNGVALGGGAVTVIRCGMRLYGTAAEFVATRFLTPATGERDTWPGCTEPLTAYIRDEADISVVAMYATAEGKLVERRVRQGRGIGVVELAITVDDLIDDAVGQLLTFEVQAGARASRYRVRHEGADLLSRYEFRNTFGCMERVSMTGARTEAPTFERSTVVAGGATVCYDVGEQPTFKVYTGRLRPGLLPVMLDMARSKEVYELLEDGNRVPLVISDVEVEHTNAPDDQRGFTFTFTPSDSRRLPAMPGGRIFDNHFDETYN